MKKIPSFTVNHLTLRRGVYVSRQDRVGDEIVTTFDVRMKAPNREPALHVNAIHTMEHLAATFLRNHPVWADRVIYWGPMGCLTGNYLILKGDLTSSEIIPLLIETYEFIAAFEGEVPGAPARRDVRFLIIGSLCSPTCSSRVCRPTTGCCSIWRAAK